MTRSAGATVARTRDEEDGVAWRTCRRVGRRMSKPVTGPSNGLQRINSDGLQPTSDCLQPNSDGLQLKPILAMASNLLAMTSNPLAWHVLWMLNPFWAADLCDRTSVHRMGSQTGRHQKITCRLQRGHFQVPACGLWDGIPLGLRIRPISSGSSFSNTHGSGQRPVL